MTKKQVLETLTPKEREMFEFIDSVSHRAILTFSWIGEVAKKLVAVQEEREKALTDLLDWANEVEYHVDMPSGFWERIDEMRRLR